MIERRPAPPMARLFVSVGALAAVGVPTFFAVVHGSTIDLGTFVYAVPIAALAFAIVASIGYASVGRGTGAGAAGAYGVRTRARGFGNAPVAQLVVGAMGLAVLGIFFLVTDADARAYASDPSCSGARLGAGACYEQDVSISDAWTTSGRGGSHPHLRVALAGGRTVAMTLAGPDSWTVYDAARDGSRDAVVQWYRGRIVAVSDSAGRSATDDMPSQRRGQFFIMAIVFAGLGIIGAVRSLLRPAS